MFLEQDRNVKVFPEFWKFCLFLLAVLVLLIFLFEFLFLYLATMSLIHLLLSESNLIRSYLLGILYFFCIVCISDTLVYQSKTTPKNGESAGSWVCHHLEISVVVSSKALALWLFSWIVMTQRFLCFLSWGWRRLGSPDSRIY